MNFAAVNCVWGAFGPWSVCSDSCGAGQKTRTRTKTTIEANGGTCTGATIETDSCGTDHSRKNLQSSRADIHDSF